jgi:hypothetical protein
MLRFALAASTLSLGVLIGACSAPVESADADAEGSVEALTQHGPNVSLDCTEQDPATKDALSISISIHANALEAKDAAGTVKHAGTLDRTYQSHGTPKVRYLVDEGGPQFGRGEFEWNMIMLEKTVFSTGEGQATVRMDAGDRSDWRFVECKTAR